MLFCSVYSACSVLLQGRVPPQAGSESQLRWVLIIIRSRIIFECLMLQAKPRGSSRSLLLTHFLWLRPWTHVSALLLCVIINPNPHPNWRDLRRTPLIVPLPFISRIDRAHVLDMPYNCEQKWPPKQPSRAAWTSVCVCVAPLHNPSGQFSLFTSQWTYVGVFTVGSHLSLDNQSAAFRPCVCSSHQHK